MIASPADLVFSVVFPALIFGAVGLALFATLAIVRLIAGRW